MFDSQTKSKFHTKCKSLIRTTETRVEVLKKKKKTVAKFLKNDIADLLNNGFDYEAYCRVEALIVEINVIDCYDSIKRFCASITANLAVIKKRDCPKECKEAIQSLICAAARFGEFPELRDFRSLLTEIYGSSLEFFADKEFVKKLKPNTASKEIKFQLMHDIAQEFAIDWSSKCLGQRLFMPQLYQNTFLESNVNSIPSSSEDEASSEGSVSDYEEDSKKNVSYSYIPSSSLSANVEKQYNKEISPKPTNKSAASETKPRSVRGRPLKPPVEDGNDGEEIDGEGNVLDGLLMQCCKEDSAYDLKKLKVNQKPPHSLLNGELSSGRKVKSELPIILGGAARLLEPVTSTRVTSGHAGASSLQQPQKCKIVHPNLPDYEDIAARIAAFSGR